MDDRLPRLALPAAILAASLAGVYIVLYRGDLLQNKNLFLGLIAAQILGVFLWNFRRWFMPFLMVIFFAAGTSVPLQGVWGSARWPALTLGAIVGSGMYLRDPRHRVGSINLAALFCVIAAVVSSTISAHPSQALLKSLSLLVLFMYTSSGARLALLDNAEQWFSVMLLSVEGMVYLTAVVYFAFRYPMFGNPNSLGAVMGVVAIPVLLWGVFATSEVKPRRRRSCALLLALALLLSSYARAAILGAAITFVLTCWAFRKFQLLFKGAALAIATAVLFVTVHPLQPQENSIYARPSPSSSVVSLFVYKGRDDLGVAASRIPVWDKTTAAIREHPWFGTGFGTSLTESDDLEPEQFRSLLVARNATREHGNSYLAIAEWVGLLGIIPFGFLVFLTARSALRVFRFMSFNHDPHFAAVPLAMVIVSGLVHAFFEDWMFAPGYYLCLIFWSAAFVIQDFPPLAPATSKSYAGRPN